MQNKEVLETLEETEFLVQEYFRDKDGQPLKLASYQLTFVKDFLSEEFQRMIFIAARQVGKSEAIACAIALAAIYSENERIINISYTDEQARIIFERVKAHLINDSEVIRNLVDLDRSLGKAKEFSRKRMFMKNGTEIRILSTGTGETEKTGESLLGFEATKLIVDEAGSIPDNIFYTKILPLISAQRSIKKGKMLVLSGTPHKPGHFEDSWNDPEYKKYKVDWKMGVEAGRLDLKTVEEAKRKMTTTDFEAFFEAKFPSMAEDSVFDMKEVERNIVSENPFFKGLKILGVDIARFGSDFTIYTQMDYCNQEYRIVDILKDEHKDLMSVTGRIVSLYNHIGFDRIIIDESGLGGGVLDRLKEQSLPAFGFIAGAKCTTEEISKNCLNLKAELCMKAKKLFEQNNLKIIAHSELLHELRLIKKDYQSNGKMKIVDPEKSPDFFDSMLMCLYSPNYGTFVVLNTKKDDGFKNWF